MDTNKNSNNQNQYEDDEGKNHSKFSKKKVF